MAPQISALSTNTRLTLRYTNLDQSCSKTSVSAFACYNMGRLYGFCFRDENCVPECCSLEYASLRKCSQKYLQSRKRIDWCHPHRSLSMTEQWEHSWPENPVFADLYRVLFLFNFAVHSGSTSVDANFAAFPKMKCGKFPSLHTP